MRSYLQSIMEEDRDGRVEKFGAPAVVVSFKTDQILIPGIGRMDLLRVGYANEVVLCGVGKQCGDET